MARVANIGKDRQASAQRCLLQRERVMSARPCFGGWPVMVGYADNREFLAQSFLRRIEGGKIDSTDDILMIPRTCNAKNRCRPLPDDFQLS